MRVFQLLANESFRNSKTVLAKMSPRKIKNSPPWLAKYKIFPPGLIQMLLLLDLLLLLLLLLLLYVFNHVLIRGREAPPYNLHTAEAAAEAAEAAA